MGTRPPVLALAVLAALVAYLVLGRAPGGGDSGPAVYSGAVEARVVRAIDGDTIEVSIDGHDEDVRYIGVDTPETVKPDTPVQCYGPEASDFNHHLVEGQTVRLTFGAEQRDVYGRLLAYVHLDGDLVETELLRRGLARTLAIAPNTDHAAQFDRLAHRAARAGRGLWGSC